METAEARVVRIPVMPLGMTNAYLIIGPNGVILVDAGLPGTESALKKVLNRNGLTFSDISLIVITHAHIDHAGNAALVQKWSGAPIVGHKADLAYFQQEEKMSFCPTGWFGRFFAKTGLIQQPYEAFMPDILMEDGDEIDVGEFGHEGIIRHTPGHTEGSISLVLEKRHAFVGDLVASGILLGGIMMTNRAKRPPFEDDPHRVGLELENFVRSGCTDFYMGHGGPLKAGEVMRHACCLRKL